MVHSGYAESGGCRALGRRAPGGDGRLLHADARRDARGTPALARAVQEAPSPARGKGPRASGCPRYGQPAFSILIVPLSFVSRLSFTTETWTFAVPAAIPDGTVTRHLHCDPF